MNKDRIIAEIRRTTLENAGVTFGQRRFSEATGISVGSWRGKYWRTWSEALMEAGFAANLPHEAHQNGALILCLVKLTRTRRAFPTYADLRMEKQADKAFPTHGAFSRLGDRSARIELVRAHAIEHEEYRDVLALLPAPDGVGASIPDEAENVELADGSVYMVKHGKHFKIGKTYDVPRRHREIALELPEKLDPIHSIRTDDPTGIEVYWHHRFAAKRVKGEWFALTRDDIRAFKRRKFM
jgi:hypothetical protein